MERQCTRFLLLLVPLLVLCLILAGPQIIYGHNSNIGKIAVVFRYDDCSGTSPVNMESKLIKVLHKHKVPCIFGVVPRMCTYDREIPSPQRLIGLSSAKVRMLKDAADKKYIQIALHGYSHQTVARQAYQLDSEFTGLPYKQQFDKISKGKRLLEEQLKIPVDTFIPPWNRYDSNTLRALREMHFTCMSADGLQVAEDDSLKYMPMTCELNEFRQAIAQARRSRADKPVITVLFHPFDFQEDDPVRGVTTIAGFDKLLGWLDSQKDVVAVTGEDAARMAGDFSPSRQKDYARLYYLSQSRLLPTFLKHDTYYYPDSASLRKLAVEQRLFIILIYAGVMALAAGAVVAGSRMRRYWTSVPGNHIKNAGLAALGCLAVYELSCGNIWFRPAVVMVGIIGIYVGTLIAPWKRRD